MKINRNFVIALIILILVLVIFTWILKLKENNVLTVSSINNSSGYIDLAKMLEKHSYIIQNSKEDNQKYTIDIYYPKTKSDTLNSYITDKLSEQIDIFNNQISGLPNETESIKKYSLKINFKAEESKKYLSFVFFTIKNVGQIHEVEDIFTVNYDIGSRNVIDIDDMIEKYSNFLVNISKYSYEELYKDKNILRYGAIDMLKDGTKAVKENFEDIIISQKYVKVYFEEYKVAPYVLGSFEINIPISVLTK